MKDARDGDLSRKISLLNGTRLHTFEYRLADHDLLLQYTNIRCILMYFDPSEQNPSLELLSLRVKEKIPAETVYELFSVVWLVLKEEPHKTKFMQMAHDDEVCELIVETEFMQKLKHILPRFHIHQVLVSEAETNEIEGLPSELTDMTLIISLRVDTAAKDVIEISDDSVIVISDDER